MRKKWTGIILGLVSLCVMAAVSGCGKTTALPGAGPGRRRKIVIGHTGHAGQMDAAVKQYGGRRLEGFDIDVWKEIARRNHWDIEWRTAEFSALWGMLDNGQIQTIANETTPNPQRLEKYNFTEPYAYDAMCLWLKKKELRRRRNGLRERKSVSWQAQSPAGAG